MITYTGRGGQPRRPINAACLTGVPLRRRAVILPFRMPEPCKACQGTGEVPRWSPEGGIFGEFEGLAICNCPAGAELAAAEDLEAIAAAGGEPVEACEEAWPGF